jgi:hypothetical protein
MSDYSYPICRHTFFFLPFSGVVMVNATMTTPLFLFLSLSSLVPYFNHFSFHLQRQSSYLWNKFSIAPPLRLLQLCAFVMPSMRIFST